MAAPTAPTLITITTQALKKAGYPSPTATQLTNAQDEFMEEIKNDIWTLAKKLKSLHTTSVMITANGQSRYSYPTDYSSDLSVTILHGSITGTAQAGSTNTITLDATDSSGETDLLGKSILITANTGKASMSQCTALDTSTKIAIVTPNFNTAPDSTSEYMAIATHYPLQSSPVWDYDNLTNPMTRGLPTHFSPIGDADYGEFMLYPVPYKDNSEVYGVQARYYANLMTLDLTSTLMATLYQRWRNVFTQGVYAKQLQKDDDNRAGQAINMYNQALHGLILREQYGMDLNNLQAAVNDY